MLILLPPSETKRDGGDGGALDLDALGFPELTRERRATIAALRRLSRNLGAATTGLRLGPTQRFEIDRNRALTTSPVLPAIERYTGVLFDAFDFESLGSGARRFADEHVVVHSALFGLLRAGDPIPAYRLSHDSRLPGLQLKRHWREAISASIARHEGLVIDLRSEGYVELGPATANPAAVYVRVVTDAAGGRKALGHFNKSAKGRLARALVDSRAEPANVAELVEWASGVDSAENGGAVGGTGIRLVHAAPGVVELIG